MKTKRICLIIIFSTFFSISTEGFSATVREIKAKRDRIHKQLFSEESLNSLSLSKKRHLFEREFRILGDYRKGQTQAIVAEKLHLLYRGSIRSIKLKDDIKKIERYTLNHISNFSTNTGRKKITQARLKELFNNGDGKTFLYIKDLLWTTRLIHEYQLDGTYPYKDLFLQVQEVVRKYQDDFTKTVSDIELIKTNGAQLINYLHWANQIGGYSTEGWNQARNLYLTNFKKAFPESIDKMDDETFRNYIYGLTHFITAGSQYYQEVITDSFYNEIHRMLTEPAVLERAIKFNLADVIAELGVCLHLMENFDDKDQRDQIMAYLANTTHKKTGLVLYKGEISKYKKNGKIANFNFLEHRNVLALMFYEFELQMAKKGRINLFRGPKLAEYVWVQKKFPQYIIDLVKDTSDYKKLSKAEKENDLPIVAPYGMGPLIARESIAYNFVYDKKIINNAKNRPDEDEKFVFPINTPVNVIPLPYIDIPCHEENGIHYVYQSNIDNFLKKQFVFKRKGVLINRYILHPSKDTISLHKKIIDHFGISGFYWGVPTSSPRSILTWKNSPGFEKPFITKLSLNKKIYGWNRMQTRLESGEQSVAISELVTGVGTYFGAKEEEIVKIIPEPLTVGIDGDWDLTTTDKSGEKKSSALIVRDASYLIEHASDLYPAFSLFSRRLDRYGERNKIPLLIKWFKESGKSDFTDYVKEFFQPIFEANARLMIKTGWVPELHLQNFLVEVDSKTKRIKKVVYRDLGGLSFVDIELMLHHGNPLNLRKFDRSIESIIGWESKKVTSLKEFGNKFFSPTQIIFNNAFNDKRKGITYSKELASCLEGQILDSQSLCEMMVFESLRHFIKESGTDHTPDTFDFKTAYGQVRADFFRNNQEATRMIFANRFKEGNPTYSLYCHNKVEEGHSFPLKSLKISNQFTSDKIFVDPNGNYIICNDSEGNKHLVFKTRDFSFKK